MDSVDPLVPDVVSSEQWFWKADGPFLWWAAMVVVMLLCLVCTNYEGVSTFVLTIFNATFFVDVAVSSNPI